MGSCPRSPKLTQLNLGPRSLAGLIIHSQFFACPACRWWSQLVRHARHVRQEIGMPSETDFDVRFSIISWESQIIAKYSYGSVKWQASCLAINADYNKKGHVCHNVCHGIDWQNWRRKPGFTKKAQQNNMLSNFSFQAVKYNKWPAHASFLGTPTWRIVRLLGNQVTLVKTLYWPLQQTSEHTKTQSHKDTYA